MMNQYKFYFVWFFLSICVKIVFTKCIPNINLQLYFIINRLLYYEYYIIIWVLGIIYYFIN